MRKTKIVATLGPASATAEGIKELIDAGVAVIRLNCSHLTSVSLAQHIELVRSVSLDVAILVDIQGPKLRYGGQEITLTSGEHVSFTIEELGLDGGGSSRGIAGGHRLLLDDGRIETVVEEVTRTSVQVCVVRGGVLKRNKGVNLPDTEILGGVLTEKDHADLVVARDMKVEIVAISFVQHPDDVSQVRGIIGEDILIIAKIERPQALVRLEQICDVADGVMTARGDLGVELPYEQLPSAQRYIALTALKRGVISICATEMLESMIENTRPTRAEVADVSGAVRDGYDAVMLSGETAVGKHPSLVVQRMASICETAETEVNMPNYFADTNPERAAVTAAAAALAKRIDAQGIIAITYTGYSARLMGACRPTCHIIAVTPTVEAARRLRVVRGVYPVVDPRDSDLTRAMTGGIRAARTAGLVHAGQTLVVCASRLSPRSDADTLLLHHER